MPLPSTDPSKPEFRTREKAVALSGDCEAIAVETQKKDTFWRFGFAQHGRFDYAPVGRFAQRAAL